MISRIMARAKAIRDGVKAWTRPSALVAGSVRDFSRTREELIAENAMLRQQLIIAQRSVKRPKIGGGDRLVLLGLARLNLNWRDALHIVKPETLLSWHRSLFRALWRRKSRPKKSEPKISAETVGLIREMARDNPWGAERIRGELLKLGICVSKRTIQKYIRNIKRRPPGQEWSMFLENHTGETWACDFLQLYDIFFRPIFALFFVKHETREVVLANVTRHPSDEWSAMQLREATPFGEGPRFLIRDGDQKFGAKFAAVAAGAGVEVVQIPARSPNCNAIMERFLRSVRAECTDHVFILGEDHLRRVLREYTMEYFNVCRPHQGVGQRIPGVANDDRDGSAEGEVIAHSILGGLHHDYRRAA